MYEKEIEQLQSMIDESNRIVFFGGAGVSTESNIPDFRSATGIYHQKYKYSPEQVVSHSFFMKYPEAFYEFYKEKMMILDAKPNAAHLKLAELEQAGKLKAVVTQNIDGLHQPRSGDSHHDGDRTRHAEQVQGNESRRSGRFDRRVLMHRN